ncbi:IS3 family transposase [Peribacillus tepidiphilus]
MSVDCSERHLLFAIDEYIHFYNHDRYQKH